MANLTQKQKIVFSFLLIGCGFFSIFAVIFYGNNRFAKKSAERGIEEIAEVIDADEDGLMDAEEKELGTNPENPDTDGDEYMDGEEVAQGTDPLNKTDFSSNASLKSLTEGNVDVSHSQAFIGALLADISDNDRLYFTTPTSSDAAQLNLSYRPEDIEQIAASLTEGFLQRSDVAATVKRPEDSELTITNDNSASAAEAYIAALYAIIGDKDTVKDLGTLFAALEDKSFTEAGMLTSNIKTIAKTRIVPALSLAEKKLRTLPVPEAWKELHKDEIVIIASEKLAVTYLADPATDAARALYAVVLLGKVGDDWAAWKEKAAELLNG